MVDLTSNAYQFTQAVAEGDFQQALGVTDGASKLDIDVAAARLADCAPHMADRITAVANVLTRGDWRSVYEILCGLRDAVYETLRDRYGDDIFEAIPDCRRVIWRICCDLLRFDLDHTDLLVGPKGTASLADRGGDWVIESVVAWSLMTLNCTENELTSRSTAPMELQECPACKVRVAPTRDGRCPSCRGRVFEAAKASTETTAMVSVIREIWYAMCPVCRLRRQVSRKTNEDHRSAAYIKPVGIRLPLGESGSGQNTCETPPCPNCGAVGAEPSRYDDTYTFTVPRGSPRGSLVQGQGTETGKVVYAILNGIAACSRPRELLAWFYREQEDGKDVTLDELEDRSPIVLGPVELKRPHPTASSGRESGWSTIILGFAAVFVVVLASIGTERSATRKRKEESERRQRELQEEMMQNFRDSWARQERERQHEEFLREGLERWRTMDEPTRQQILDHVPGADGRPVSPEARSLIERSLERALRTDTADTNDKGESPVNHDDESPPLGAVKPDGS